ncbi:MAG: flavodoxin, partial [Candidatus Fimimonas sp.]
PKVVLTDLARCDMSEAVEDAFRYGKLVLATVTYNLQIFPFMREFIADLTERNYQNRSIAIIGNGSWAPVAGKLVADAFANSKNVDIVGTVTVVSSMTEQNKEEISALAKALLEK